jgi:hypothetical protein
MDNIEKFKLLFSDFDLKIIAKASGPEKTKTLESNDYNNSDQKSKSDLKKTFNRLTKEYKAAQRSFKHNKISRQELFDFEWRLFEIQEELRKIEDKERGESL